MANKYDSIGRVSSASVEKGTGKGWEHWVKLLAKAGAKNWSHQEIVKYLRTKHKLTPWWQQGVALGFEIATGLRVEGQNLKGEYSAMASRTFPLSAKKLWRLISSPQGIETWLAPMGEFQLAKKSQYEVEGGIFGEVRTIKAGERARLTWQETDWLKPTVLNLMIIPREGAKAILVFQHDQLKTARQREELRERWKHVLEKLLMLSENDTFSV